MGLGQVLELRRDRLDKVANCGSVKAWSTTVEHYLLIDSRPLAPLASEIALWNHGPLMLLCLLLLPEKCLGLCIRLIMSG